MWSVEDYALVSLRFYLEWTAHLQESELCHQRSRGTESSREVGGPKCRVLYDYLLRIIMSQLLHYVRKRFVPERNDAFLPFCVPEVIPRDHEVIALEGSFLARFELNSLVLFSVGV